MIARRLAPLAATLALVAVIVVMQSGPYSPPGRQQSAEEFILPRPTAHRAVSTTKELEDPPPPLRTDEEIELARLARTCRGDGYTRAIRAYIKANGAEAAIPYLIHAFGNSCGGCPARARIILLEIGTPAVPALIAAVQQRKQGITWHLAEILPSLDAAMPLLITALKDTQDPHRERLIELVERLESRAKNTVPVLIWILEHDESATLELQIKSARGLCAIGPDAASAGPALVQLLKDLKLPDERRPKRRRSTPTLDDRQLSYWPPRPPFWSDPLLEGVGRLGPESVGVLDYLLAEIENAQNRSAFDAIALLGDATGRARVALRAAVVKCPPYVRPKAYYALWKTGEPFDEVLPFILEDLKNSEPGVRGGAIEVLGEIGAPALVAFSQLLSATRDPELHVRSTALRALAKIKPPAESVVPSLIELLNPKSKSLNEAVDCLREYGSDANSAIPRIVELLQVGTELNPRLAAHDILHMGTAPAAAIPGLTSLLSDSDWVVQTSAAELLGNLGENGREAIPRLRELINKPPRANRSGEVIDLRDRFANALLQIAPDSTADQDLIAPLLDATENYTRLHVASLLWKSPRYQERCIQELAKGLSHERVSVREKSAEFLAEIGPAAEPARVALNDALGDDEASVRVLAQAALEKIGK